MRQTSLGDTGTEPWGPGPGMKRASCRWGLQSRDQWEWGPPRRDTDRAGNRRGLACQHLPQPGDLPPHPPPLSPTAEAGATQAKHGQHITGDKNSVRTGDPAITVRTAEMRVPKTSKSGRAGRVCASSKCEPHIPRGRTAAERQPQSSSSRHHVGGGSCGDRFLVHNGAVLSASDLPGPHTPAQRQLARTLGAQESTGGRRCGAGGTSAHLSPRHCVKPAVGSGEAEVARPGHVGWTGTLSLRLGGPKPPAGTWRGYSGQQEGELKVAAGTRDACTPEPAVSIRGGWTHWPLTPRLLWSPR